MESATPTPSVVETGVSGTAVFSGDILAESNAKLTYQQAYGQVGTRSWGEWEDILRTNPFVAAALDFVVAPIRDARLGIEAADETPEARAQADFVKWNFESGMEPGFQAFLDGAARGMLNAGFSLFEPVFRQVKHEALPGGVGYGLKRVAERLPNTMAFNAWLETPDGTELRAVKQRGPRGGKWVDVEIPAEKLLLFTWGRSGNNYAGFSVWRPVWYVAQIQKELLRLVGVTYQREGAGVPVASAADINAPLTSEQRDQLAELLANLVYHENAHAVMPPGWKLDWLFSGGANKGHVLDAWRQLGTVILQQVSAQQLALGMSDTGSRSVGETHDARAMSFVQGVVAILEGALNGIGSRPYTGLVRRLVDANWGPQEKYPKLTLTLKRPQLAPGERVNAMKSAVDGGIITLTADDENVVREELGLAPIDAAERDALKEAKRALAPPAFGLPPVKKEAPEGDEAGEVEDDEKEAAEGLPPPKAKASARRGPWVPSRPLRATEKRLALESIDGFFATQRDAFEALVRPAVVEALVRAQPSLTKAMADGNPDEVATMPLDFARLEAAVAEFLATARKAGQREVVAEVRRGKGEKVAEERRAEEAPSLKAAEEEEDDQRAKDRQEAEEDADDVLEAQKKALVRRMANRLRSELESEAIDVLRTGGDASEVVTRTVSRQLETGAFKADAGSVLTRAFNVGRDEAARVMGGVSQVEYSAVLDGRQCIPCNGMDGKRAPFGSSEHDAMLPPNRDCAGGGNCRCLVVYLTEEDE